MLSDSCIASFEAVGDAARKLADDARHYSDPETARRLFAEIGAVLADRPGLSDTRTAGELTRRGVPTAGGSDNWTPAQVARVRRLAAAGG